MWEWLNVAFEEFSIRRDVQGAHQLEEFGCALGLVLSIIIENVVNTPTNIGEARNAGLLGCAGHELKPLLRFDPLFEGWIGTIEVVVCFLVPLGREPIL
jgi:hypothetical protein